MTKELLCSNHTNRELQKLSFPLLLSNARTQINTVELSVHFYYTQYLKEFKVPILLGT